MKTPEEIALEVEGKWLSRRGVVVYNPDTVLKLEIAKAIEAERASPILHDIDMAEELNALKQKNRILVEALKAISDPEMRPYKLEEFRILAREALKKVGES